MIELLVGFLLLLVSVVFFATACRGFMADNHIFEAIKNKDEWYCEDTLDFCLKTGKFVGGRKVSDETLQKIGL